MNSFLCNSSTYVQIPSTHIAEAIFLYCKNEDYFVMQFLGNSKFPRPNFNQNYEEIAPAMAPFQDAFAKITRNEGIASLWSGLSPTLVLAIPATVIYFVTYEQLRLKIKDSYNKSERELTKFVQPFWVPLVAGASARLMSVTIVSPLELIRTKMQSKRLSYFGKQYLKVQGYNLEVQFCLLTLNF